MTAVHLIVGLASVLAVTTIALSVLRSVVLPRGVPTRLARIAILGVRAGLRGWLRLTRRAVDYETRDRVLALQAPLGVFAQLVLWTTLLIMAFSALFWAVSGGTVSDASIAHAIELGGSSAFSEGTEAPHGLVSHLVGFAAAGVGLILLALVVTYLPTLYSAFSRREASIAKLAVRTGNPTTGVGLLVSTWELHRFDQFEEVWDSWEDWFLELGESHTTFPQLSFFRSPRPEEHWVLAAEAILDGTSLVQTICDINDTSRAELCQRAGNRALTVIAQFLGIPDDVTGQKPRTSLPREKFDEAYRDLAARGVPMRDDRAAAWKAFVACRAEYEPLLAVLGAITDAPRSPWSSWSYDTPRHNPPIFRIHPA